MYWASIALCLSHIPINDYLNFIVPTSWWSGESCISRKSHVLAVISRRYLWAQQQTKDRRLLKEWKYWISRTFMEESVGIILAFFVHGLPSNILALVLPSINPSKGWFQACYKEANSLNLSVPFQMWHLCTCWSLVASFHNSPPVTISIFSGRHEPSHHRSVNVAWIMPPKIICRS